MASHPKNANANDSSASNSCCDACKREHGDYSGCNDKHHGSSFSAEPVRYSDGEVYLVTEDMQFKSFGMEWGHTRSYSNLVTEPGTGNNGNSWFVKEWPYLAPSNLNPADPNTPGTICLVWVIQQALWFDYDATAGRYRARFNVRPKLRHDAVNKIFTLTESTGRVTSFYDFDPSYADAMRGQFRSITDVAGRETVAVYGANNLIASFVQEAEGQSSGFHYSYESAGVNAGMLKQVRYEVNGAPVQRVSYSYHTGVSGHGSAGDLERAYSEQYKEGTWQGVSSNYYRYYKEGQSYGMKHGLRFVVGPQSYQAMLDAGITPEVATNRQVANYARHEFRYETGGGVTEETVNSGTATYGYGRTQSAFADEFNTWKTKAVEDLPDGNRQLVYTNFAGQTILKVLIQMKGGTETGRQWYEHYQYDGDGRTLMQAESSAVASYDESNPGLVTLKANQGKLNIKQYYPPGSSPGGAPNRLRYEMVQKGASGTPITVRELQYARQAIGTTAVYQPSQEILYRSASGGGTVPMTTSYAYEWNNFQVVSKTTTYPAVPASQNGSGMADTLQETFDNYGRLTWQRDPRGYITGFSYATGADAPTQQVQDVSGGAPWPVLPGSHLNLITDYTVDSSGRTVQTLEPVHEIDLGGTTTMVRQAQWTVYLDASSQVWSAAGYQSVSDGSFTLINPVNVQRFDKGNRLIHDIQAVRASVEGPLVATDSFPQSSWVRWTFNDYGPYTQVAKQRVYHNIPTAGAGKRGLNYEQADYKYDILQRKVRDRSPGGTITRYVYNPKGWLLGRWTGTHDAGATNNNPAGSGSSHNNMVVVEANQYDNDRAGGNGNLTRVTKVAGVDDTRVTAYGYDWRNRQTSSAGEIGSYEAYTLDNQDQVTRTDKRDGSAGGTLVGRQETAYDNRGRTYCTKQYAVDLETGVIGNALVSNTWYDPSGNVIQQQGAGAESFTQTDYDQIDRTAVAYLTVNPDGSGEPGDVTDDIVIEQTETTYDPAGNTILQVRRERFHNATGTGPLTSPTGTQPQARVTYVANWQDALGRIVTSAGYGTNGGSAPTRPAVAPAGSDTVLVTSLAYNDRGELWQTTDPAGKITQTVFDDTGRKIKETRNVTGGSGPDQNNETLYTYSPDGLLKTLTAKNDVTGDQVTEWVYGTSLPGSAIASSRLLAAKIYPDLMTDRVDYLYNGQSQVIQTTDQRGTIHQFDYDALGRLLNDRVTTLGAGVDGTVRRISYEYDVRGLTTSITSFDNPSPTAGAIVNQVVNTYNDFGQLVSQQQEHGGAVTTGSPQVGYAYADGSANTIRIAQLTYPNGRQLNYSYGTAGGNDDQLSRVEALIDNDGVTHLADYQYVGAGAFAIVGYAQPGIALTYVKQGSEPVGDGGDQYTGWDRFGRIIDQRWLVTSSGTAVERLKYGYDRMSNRLWRQNVVAGSGQDGLYSYDGLYQLQQLQRGTLNSTHTALTGTPAWEEDWTYDPTGNWDEYQTKTSGTTTLNQSRTHSEANAIQTISGSAALVGYDLAGNMTTAPRPGNWSSANTFTWDAWNRLIAVNDASSTVATYTYDGLTRRVTGTDSTGTIRHYYYSTAWQILEERIGTSTSADRQFVWGKQGVDNLVLRDRTVSGSTERFYSLSDPLNVTAICDTTGAIQERYGYTAFGTSNVMDPSFAPRTSSSYEWETRFGAYRYDQNTQLYQVRYRYLHSELGRWLSRDPLAEKGGMNLYVYVKNNSPNVEDVFGLQAAAPAPAPTPALCCIENGKKVSPVSMWTCTRPLRGWEGNFEFHEYVCCDGPNQNCYGIPNNDLKKGDPIPPEGPNGTGSGGTCTKKTVCPATKKAHCDQPRSPRNCSTLFWNCQDWSDWNGTSNP